jgi:hypothetical protein
MILVIVLILFRSSYCGVCKEILCAVNNTNLYLLLCCRKLQEFDVSVFRHQGGHILITCFVNVQNFAAVMSVSEDLLCSFELLKVCVRAQTLWVLAFNLTSPIAVK